MLHHHYSLQANRYRNCPIKCQFFAKFCQNLKSKLFVADFVNLANNCEAVTPSLLITIPNVPMTRTVSMYHRISEVFSFKIFQGFFKTALEPFTVSIPLCCIKLIYTSCNKIDL